MCIRDSAIPAQVRHARHDRRRRGQHQRTRAEHDQNGDAAAVSYTHLRAHETVLDLVCRLLLEKKKQRENEQKQR